VLRKLAASALLSVSVATVYVLLRGTPAVGTPEASPNTIDANRPALITVTIRIPESRFKRNSVDLVRVDRSGHVLSEVEMRDEDGENADAIVGHRFFLRMRDDGTKGDAVANDGVFTRRIMLKESSGPLYFEVHASFSGIERPVRSEPFAVGVRP